MTGRFGMEKTLTVVIPAYNVEKYIEKCLDSFLNIEVLSDLEILVVNDGSTDHTEEIAKKYADKYPSSIQVLTKENGGHGSTINYAVPLATGKYFKVVDGDDWVDTSLLPEFIKMLKRVNSDVISNDFNLINDSTEKVSGRRKAVKNSYHYNREWGFAEAVVEPIVTIHSMTIRTDVIKKCPVKLDEHCFYEDQEYILYPIPFCTSITFAPEPIYQYRLGRNGQSVDINVMIKRHDQHLRVLNSLYEYNDMNDMIPTYKKKYLERGIAEAVDDEYQIFLAKGNVEGNKQELMEFDKKLKKEHPGIYEACKRKSVWMLRKSKFRLFPFATWLYSKVKK